MKLEGHERVMCSLGAIIVRQQKNKIISKEHNSYKEELLQVMQAEQCA